MSQTLHMDLCC